jgi:predicted transcriptional regulator
MPVTLNLPPDLLERAQKLADTRDTDVDTLLLEVLTEYLEDDQSWYWSKEWQGAEQEAEADIAAGNYADFTSMEDFFADMDQ